MATDIEVTFPENLKVEAKINDYVLTTDQPKKSGGDGSAPSPTELFTVSIATCSGYFALKFCRTRNLETTGMRLKMRYEWDKEQKRYPTMAIELELPERFPEKYRGAIIKAMNQCVVKQHIQQPPEFEITVI
ncbi:MAG: osmotically inducible protein OsmC [Desulfobacterales bacterium]|nr:osmotically inducible protein OsmC [Desulfobacterales bacterium]